MLLDESGFSTELNDSFPTPTSRPVPADSLRHADLCCGAGGFTRGLHGIISDVRTTIGIDIVPAFTHIFATLHPDVRGSTRDLSSDKARHWFPQELGGGRGDTFLAAGVIEEGPLVGLTPSPNPA